MRLTALLPACWLAFVYHRLPFLPNNTTAAQTLVSLVYVCLCCPYQLLPVAVPSRLSGFVSAGIQHQGQPEKAATKAQPAAMAANPEEMELEEEAEEQVSAQQAEDDDSAAGGSHEVQLQQKAVPAAVFGGARESGDDEEGQQAPPALGALDRFKKRKTKS